MKFYKSIKNIVIAFGALSVFNGCIGTTVPPMNNYAFKCNDSLIEKVEQKQYNDTLKISLPNTSSALTRRDIIFHTDNGKIGSYAYSQWVDTPADLLQNILLRTLITSNLFTAVVRSSSNVESGLQLESEILQFVHKVDTKSVEVQIVLTLLDQTSRKLLKAKLFSYSIKVEKNNAENAVSAFNSAMNNLQKDIIIWLSNS